MVERFCTLLINCLFGRTDSSRAAFFILIREQVKEIKVKEIKVKKIKVKEIKVNVKVKATVIVKVNVKLTARFR